MNAKSIISNSVTGLALLVSASAVMAATVTPVTVTGGTINFTGKVIDAACTLDLKSSSGPTVALGQVKASELASVGATSQPVAFTIKLVDCDTSTYTAATFGFSGVSDSKDPTALANTAGPGAATNVGVQLKDSTGGKIALDGSFGTGAKVTLQDGENIANFTAAMIAVGAAGDVTTGDVQSTANFNIQYD